jgi:hypothetical protein
MEGRIREMGWELECLKLIENKKHGGLNDKCLTSIETNIF